LTDHIEPNSRLIRAFTALNLMLVLLAAALVLAPEERPLAPSAAAAPADLSQLQLKRSPIDGVVDLYWQDHLVQNLVPLVRWSTAAGVHYNNAEIQEAAINLNHLADGLLISYQPFEREEHVDGAPPQPASGVKMSLLVRQTDHGLLITPIIEANPHQLTLDIGLGHFFGIHHGTNLVTMVRGGEELAVQPEAPRTEAALLSLGQWLRFARISEASLHSSRQDMPTLTLGLSRGSGELHLEVRDRPWVPQLAARRGLDQWVEAVVMYAPADQFPLYIKPTE
jgi:hypothetical protein